MDVDADIHSWLAEGLNKNEELSLYSEERQPFKRIQHDGLPKTRAEIVTFGDRLSKRKSLCIPTVLQAFNDC